MVKDSEKPSRTGQTQPNIQGLYTALDLMELGIELVRQRFIRQHPEADEAAITAHVNEWIRTPRSASKSPERNPSFGKTLSIRGWEAKQ